MLFSEAGRSPTGRPRIPAVGELVDRAGELERVLDDVYAIDDAETARWLLDQLLAIRADVRHVDDIVRLLLHDQVGLSWREQGAHQQRYHNAVRARYQRAKRRHPGGLDEAIRAPVWHDDPDRADTGD